MCGQGASGKGTYDLSYVYEVEIVLTDTLTCPH